MTTPVTCGAGWADLTALREPSEAAPIDRNELRGRVISAVHIEGVSAELAGTLVTLLRTRAGQRLEDAPLRDDLRTLWALGVVDDVRVDIDGDRVSFVIAPRPLIGKVIMPRRDPVALKRFDLLAGAAFEPRRIARIAAGIEMTYQRDGYVDARVNVRRAERGHVVDVCVAATPGPKVTIGRVTFPGRKQMPEGILVAQLHGEKAGINRPGGLYDADALEVDRMYLTNEYYERGMMNVQIGEPHTRRVEEGPVFTLGEITIKGGPRVPTGIDYGEVFARSRIQAARDRVAEQTGADVVILTRVDNATQRIHVTFELSWRYPWDALRLWLSR
jgi:outer membrane protein assembly factor BamA